MDNKLDQQGVFITAEIHIKDQVPLAQGIAAVRQFCVDMNSEPGCSLAMALQNKTNPKQFVFWERYDDQAAFDAHFAADHTQAFIKSALTDLQQAFDYQLLTTEG
ncbi:MULTISPECIES: putative quinol monooxygenase [unclassified Shewanella]|jgi:quinol monooxygenase YgiN|uniref:putative quinol monooxygenase n=1 Tax=unclassified Shewanella TaxID=196818 RepID=UPI001F5B67E4|nr:MULTISPECIES: antibiotic biosynthesis monooxygenase [unclassified Shewanella]|tara:strand:+ start:16 stop:330 length:315 start_codon:yes stop_codon:yes gene_type:complete